MSAQNSHAVPRAAPLLNRFPGNAHEDLLRVLLEGLWTSLVSHLEAPVHSQHCVKAIGPYQVAPNARMVGMHRFDPSASGARK